jgi:Tol biopolymer transport system component
MKVADGSVRRIYATPDAIGAIIFLADDSGFLSVVSDPKQGNKQISFVSYPDGKRSRFTNDLSTYSPCCLDITSDDQKLVAVQTSTTGDIYILPGGDSRQAKQITAGDPVGFGVRFGKDHLFAGNLRGELLQLNLDGSNAHPFVSGIDRLQGGAKCGDYVILVGVKDSLDLWRANSDGSNLTRLTSVGRALNPACTPDHKSVLFSDGTNMFTVPIDGGQVQPATQFGPGTGYVTYSGSGKYMMSLYGGAQYNYRTHCKITNVADGKTVTDFELPLGGNDPKFAPDEKSLQFLLAREGATNVWAQPFAGKPMYRLTEFPAGDSFGFDWSTDGKTMVMSRGTQRSDVVLMTNFH